MEKIGRAGIILKWSKRIRWTLMLLVLAYGAVCAYLWATQRHHIFEPRPLLQTSPERLGLKFEEVHIQSGNGDERGDLYSWWLPAENADAPTILYLHGNDKNIGAARDLNTASRMHDMGYNLLMVDYRGYGKSTGGEPSEQKLYEDAESAWQYLIKQRVIPSEHVFIYGHSLGSAIAIELALHHSQAGGVIAESAFTSMVDMAKRQYKYLPADMLVNQRFDSLDKIGHLKIPVLLIHGTWDRLIPYQMSQRLFESAPQPKYLKLIEGGEHGSDGFVAPLEYRTAITEFIQRYAVQH